MQKKIKRLKKWLRNMSLRTKLYIAIGFGGVVVAILLTIVLVIINQQHPAQTIEPTASASDLAKNAAVVQQSQRDGSLRDSAEQAIASGDTSKADDVYKAAIEAEQSTSRKVQLSIDQSGVLYAAGKYDEAIQVAKAAESISDDKFLVADWLSRLYEDQHQYAQAAQYYTEAGQFAKSPTNLAKLSKSYYDSQAARVSALVGKQ